MMRKWEEVKVGLLLFVRKRKSIKKMKREMISLWPSVDDHVKDG